jgi:hypothetical protein
MLMDRYDAWKRNPLLRQIQRAAGIDPDGPPRPMLPPEGPLRRETRRKLRRASEVAYRDALLRRALGFLW